MEAETLALSAVDVDTLGEVEAETLAETLVDVEADALFVTLVEANAEL